MTISVNVRDKVIDIYGKEGYVKKICGCKRCGERGWFEPVVEYPDGTIEWINDSDWHNGFFQYYQIGESIFPEHLHYDKLELLLQETIEGLKRLKNQAENLQKMMNLSK